MSDLATTAADISGNLDAPQTLYVGLESKSQGTKRTSIENQLHPLSLGTLRIKLFVRLHQGYSKGCIFLLVILARFLAIADQRQVTTVDCALHSWLYKWKLLAGELKCEGKDMDLI